MKASVQTNFSSLTVEECARKGQSSCPGSDTSTDQSAAALRTARANGRLRWACACAARCVFWSLLNDCSKNTQSVSARSSVCCLCPRVCVCVCVCARRAGAIVAASLCHGPGSASIPRAARLRVITRAPLLRGGLIHSLSW